MPRVLLRTESVELTNQWYAWLSRAGHEPILTASLAAARTYLERGRRIGNPIDVVVSTLPPTERGAELLAWHWLDGLRRSAGPAPILLVASHPTLAASPRPGSVEIVDLAVTEPEFARLIERLVAWSATRRPSRFLERTND